ncbi:o-succinylbenzoate synthase [Corynebacterium felinum]|uniref:o-succinylbenzoate synthase n=1 Tax=Corynebacterium felinum TaxID=131318 RepID=A0ABU2B7I6_9CORY|nr:o-succinylbenzoate synthase [Corynebacterium felinum]MDF5819944.1 o-succinylbenzoate synthase [Corynebacterium felinum]MDR7354570.1 O-succinylbenzoate synthase [Corynebacterium felinum]WJY93937.1 Muconate cycloisomerase 1 [Corynebacterium felinum]
MSPTSRYAPIDYSTLSLDDILERARVVSLPLRVRFRGVREREALVIEGPCGWGEFSPFLEYDAAESASWLKCGLEMAFVGPPVMLREKIEVNATVPAVPAVQVEGVLEHFPGCRTVKVKVAEKGQTLADDIERVATVREIIPNAIIRVDANQAWTVDQALEAAQQLGPLDYMEQPCATVAELAELRMKLVRAGLFVRVAADESIRRADDPYAVAAQKAADVAVVKPAPLGGPRNVLAIAQHYRAQGLDVTVASALDTGVGMNAGLAAVAALPVHADDDDCDVPPAPAGLATQRLFVADITPQRTLIDGYLRCDMLAPDPARLAEFQAEGPRRDFWLNRLRECWAFL